MSFTIQTKWERARMLESNGCQSKLYVITEAQHIWIISNGHCEGKKAVNHKGISHNFHQISTIVGNAGADNVDFVVCFMYHKVYPWRTKLQDETSYFSNRTLRLPFREREKKPN